MDFWDSKEFPVDFPNSKDRFLGFLGSARLGSARLGSARLGSARNSWIPSLLARAPAAASVHPTAADSPTRRMGRTADPEMDLPACQHTSTRFLAISFRRRQTTSVRSQNSQMDRRYHILRVGNPSDKKKAISVGNVWRPEWNFEPRGCNQPAQEIPRNIPECSEVWRRF
jgi:hypothetical protein